MFETLEAIAAPMPQGDVDTDIIYPGRFLLITEKQGLGRYAFHDWRFDAAGARIDGFVLDQPRWAGAQILVTGPNFGCGSSREHAPWALKGLGIACIIATSFGEIFYGNCFKNGILPIIVSADEHRRLMADAEAGHKLVIDLQANMIRRPDGEIIAFTLDPHKRMLLLNGWDDVDLIRAQYSAMIDAHETQQRQEQSWLWIQDMAKAV